MRKKLMIFLVLITIVLLIFAVFRVGRISAQKTLNFMIDSGKIGYEPSREGEFAGFDCKFSNYSSEWRESASWESPQDFQKWKKQNGNDSVGIQYADFCTFFGPWELKPYQGEARLVPIK